MAAVIHDPGGLGEDVKSLFGWVVVHADGDESVAGIIGTGPLIAAQYRVAMKSKPAAERLARETGKTVKLVRYDAQEVLEEVRP